MIASAREACLAFAVASGLAACGGASVGSPSTLAVLVEPEDAGGALTSAFLVRGVGAERPAVAGPRADAVAEARRELARAIEAQQSFREPEAIESLSRA